MKQIFYLIGFVFILTACASDLPEQLPDEAPRIPPLSADITTNDSIKIDNIANDSVAMDKLIDRIDESLFEQNITESEIKRGFYDAEEGDRKWGTPPSWVWFEYEGRSFWISPEEKMKWLTNSDRLLCEKTGGRYLISCVETDLEDCNYVPENTCECHEDSAWLSGQGCLQIDSKGNWLEISDEELTAGWYSGRKEEKKYNTPIDWIWIEDEEGGKWQNDGGI